MREYKKEETALFYTGWAIVFLAALFLWVLWLFPLPYDQLTMPCILHSMTGLYCPGCGGTRAVYALLHRHLFTSFICHPLVPYTAVCGSWFLVSQSIERFSRHRIRIGMHYRDLYLWIALGITVANFIVKNLLLVVFQIDLLDGMSIGMKIP